MENKTQAAWTAIFLICIPNDDLLLPEAKQMFTDIFSLKIKQEINAVFCIDAYEDFLQLIDPSRDPGSVSRDAHQSVFYSLENDLETGNGMSSRLLQIGTNPAFDIKSKDSIAEFFKKYVIEMHPADNYLLFTWGHGAAFGLFFESNQVKTKIGQPHVPVKMDMLSISDLSDAIVSSFGTEKSHGIKIVIMMNCFMQLFDTGFELHRANVEYLIASENTQSCAGYNYKEIFGRLFQSPELLPKSLGSLAVKSLENKGFLEDHIIKNDLLLQTGVFANDLNFYDQMAGLLKELATSLTNMINGHFKTVHIAVSNCHYYGVNYMLIDLFRFVEQLKNLLPNNEITGLLDKIDALYNDIVYEKYIGSKVKKEFPKAFPMGISICLPHTRKDSIIAFFTTYMNHDSPFASKFARDSEWSVFVEKFLNYPDTSV